MTRLQAGLVGLLVVELAIGGYLAVQWSGQPSPPMADYSAIDIVATEQLRTASAGCRTAKDWSRLADLNLAAGFFPQAEACYRQALEVDPTNPDRLFQHGFALERLGLLDEANQRYLAAIERGHSRANDLRYYVGRNQLRQGAEDPATETFTRAIDLPAARLELAKLHARNRRIAEAQSLTDALAKEFPKSFAVTSLQYRLALTDDSLEAREKLADQFARQPGQLPNPFDNEVNYFLGVENKLGRRGLLQDAVAALQSGQFEKAAESAQAALDAGWTPEVADCLAEAEFANDRKSRAVSLLAEAVEQAGPSYTLLWRLGQGYDAIGDRERALAAWERAIRVTTGPAAQQDLQTDLASRYKQLGRHDRARHCRALAMQAAGVNAMDAGQLDAAATQLRQSIELDSRQAQTWFYLGEVDRLSGRVPLARRAYNECLTINPDHGRAHRAMALCTDRP